MAPPQKTPKYLHPAPPHLPCAVFPAFPCGHPHLAALQAVLAALLPFWDPWVSTSTLAASSAAAVPRPPRCQAPAHPHCPHPSAIQINIVLLFPAVSLQSHSPYTLRHCPAQGSQRPQVLAVLSKKPRKGAACGSSSSKWHTAVSALQSSWTTGRFPKLGSGIKELSMLFLPPILNFHMPDDNCLLNGNWESAHKLHLLPCPSYFKIGIAESVAWITEITTDLQQNLTTFQACTKSSRRRSKWEQ